VPESGDPRRADRGSPSSHAKSIAVGADRGTRVLTASITFALAVALATYGGVKLDEWAGTTPLFLIVGVAWGFFGGFFYLLKQLAPDLLPGARPADRGDANDQVTSRSKDSEDRT
jgi:F0F1-type ATP synthase assembly protein I